jgi:hypothetical protein
MVVTAWARIDGPLEPLDSWVLAGACKAKPPLRAHGVYVVGIFRGACIALVSAFCVPSTYHSLCCYQYYKRH